MSKVSTNKMVRVEYSDKGKAMVKCHDRYLVERDGESGWKLTEPKDRFVSDQELGTQFGLWKDASRVKREPRRLLPGTRVAERFLPNGKIENDEVVPFGRVLKGKHEVDLGVQHWNHLYATVEQAVPQQVELTLKPDGGNFTTSWSVKRFENYLPANVPCENNGYLWAEQPGLLP